MFQITAQDLSKEYRIYTRPVDRLLEAVTRQPRHRVMTALDGISFALKKGHFLGIIGVNGAGKSTLLKILVGTLTPTRGWVEMTGRVAALLELGAGFHPEFTGRQNILLSASLMGISHEEIGAREEEIIAFSELEDFIDRPVKTYSSGMYIRLAFGIATSVNADILVVDEALAVGDMAFQRKCIDRMIAFRDSGRTMVFCSHSMYHVQELCDTVLWLNKGVATGIGSPQEIIPEYEDFCNAKGHGKEIEAPQTRSRGEKECLVKLLRLETRDGRPVEVLEPLADVVMHMEVEILKDNIRPHFGFALLTPSNSIVCATMTHHDGIKCGPYRAGENVSIFLRIKDFPLKGGTFRLLGGVAEDSGLLWHEYKQIGPIVIKGEKGVGEVTFRRDWELLCG